KSSGSANGAHQLQDTPTKRNENNPEENILTTQATTGSAGAPESQDASNADAPVPDPDTPEVAIEVSNVFKVFGRNPKEAVRRLKAGESRGDVQTHGTAAVIDASFTVKKGEIFVVMGLSGSGKSTLIRMLNGLNDTTDGSIKVSGTEIVGMNTGQLRSIRRDRLSMVFQHFALLPHRTVIDNVAYGLEIQGVPVDKRLEQARYWIERVGLSGWEEHLPSELSGGM